MSIKLVATDIDGTIMGHDFTISEGVKFCIKKLSNMGIKVILVTGRMHTATDYVAEELELDTPIVSYQGGLVKHKDDIIYERNLEPEVTKEIIRWAKKKDVHINLYMNDQLYVEKDDAVVRRYTGERHTGYKVGSFEDLTLARVNKLLAIDFNDHERVTKWLNELQLMYPGHHVVKSTPYFCEVCHGHAKKSNAVNYLKEYYGFTTGEVLTIGDQNNDIELLTAGGIKIAMGNATDELKATADYVTLRVEDDGFVTAMEQFVIGGDNETRV